MKADGFRRVEVITGVGRRRCWTDEEKAWIVAESLDPATTVSAVGESVRCRIARRSCWPCTWSVGEALEILTLLPAGVLSYKRMMTLSLS
jgi:hypothetical protein